MPSSARERSDIPALLGVFLGSCLVHGAFAWLAWSGGTGLMGDEASYLDRAEAFSRIFGQLLGGGTVAPSDLDTVYARGVWPPLHPLLLGAVIRPFSDPLLAARLWAGLLASLTSVVVYRLGAHLFSRPAGWMAAGLHVASPIFVGYSHFLWSETLYVLLLLGLFALTLRQCESSRPGSALLGASAGGLLLGAMALTRAAVAPLYFLLPLLLGFTGSPRGRALRVACFLILALGLTAPWHEAIRQREGRLLLFSTHASVQLYLGNNPFASDLVSYATSQRSAEREFDRALREIQQQAALTGRHTSDAARALALGFIREEPLGFLRRSVSRALVLVSGDSFVLRHALATVYPPLSVHALLASWLGGLVFSIATLALGLATLLLQPLRRPATLAAWIFVVGSVAPPLLTLSHSRLGLPLLAVLLPYAGHGAWSCLRRLPGWRRLGGLAAGIAALLVANAAALLPVNYRVLGQPSSFYAPLLAALDRLYPGETIYEDFLGLRDTGDGGLELRLDRAVRGELVGPKAARGARELDWSGPGTRQVALLTESVARPPTLWLRRPGEEWIEIEPIRANAWRTWAPTPIAGVFTYWSGGAGALETPAP